MLRYVKGFMLGFVILLHVIYVRVCDLGYVNFVTGLVFIYFFPLLSLFFVFESRRDLNLMYVIQIDSEIKISAREIKLLKEQELNTSPK